MKDSAFPLKFFQFFDLSLADLSPQADPGGRFLLGSAYIGGYGIIFNSEFDLVSAHLKRIKLL
jgi:hypothetical protein